MIAVRYFSRGGNTEKLARSIADALNTEALDVSVPLKEHCGILFLGSAVYAGGVDESIKAFLAENAEKIGLLVNFSTAAVLHSTAAQVRKLAAQHGIAMADEEFSCRGSFAFMHRGRPNAEDLRAAAFAEKFREVK